MFSHIDIRALLEWAVRRFPLPVIITFILSWLWFYQVNTDASSEWLYRTIIVAVVSFFFSVGCTLFTEWLWKSRYNIFIANLVPLLFAWGFYLSLYNVYDPSLETITYIILTLSGFIAFVFVAPYLLSYGFKKSENTVHFYNYFVLIAWVFLMSIIVGWALFALGAIAISAVDALFSISKFVNDYELYANWAIIAITLIAPLYGLVQIPVKSEYEKNTYEKNRFFSFLIQYVSTPFIYIYFFILYAYSIKVLLNFNEWPKGIISWMVIGFSSFGYLIYIFSQAYADKSKMISFFRKYFSFFVLPQVGMLFYAIYLRIAQYDITMNRYFVVAFGVWLMGISLYYLISRSKHLSLIPASLLAIILIISVGPWSVYNVPLTRQYDRLVRNLEKANILNNSVITPLASPKDISKELSNEIYSEISYICDFDNCKRIKELFKKEVAEATIKDRAQWEKYNTTTGSVYKGISRWTIVSAVTEKIKVQSTYYGESPENNKYIQYSSNKNNEDIYPIVLENGYTHLVRVYGEYDGNEKSTRYDGEKFPYITINPDTMMLSYHRGSGDILSIAFVLPEGLTSGTIPTNLDQSDLTFMIKDKKIDIKLMLQSLAVKNPSYKPNDENNFYDIVGLAFVKEIR